MLKFIFKHISLLWESTRIFAEEIRISHTLLAMPFAGVAGMFLLAQEDISLSKEKIFWIALAMVGARTFAMGMNRWLDAAVDGCNPRTRQRAIPSRRLSASMVLLYSIAGALLLVLASAQLSFLCLLCSGPVLALLSIYPLLKHVTVLCHLYLGFCLALAPLGVSVALMGQASHPAVYVLSLGVMLWTAGFDVCYALADREFDIRLGLYSIPARYGKELALLFSLFCQVSMLSCVLYAGYLAEQGWFYWLGSLGFIYVVGEQVMRPTLGEAVISRQVAAACLLFFGSVLDWAIRT